MKIMKHDRKTMAILKKIVEMNKKITDWLATPPMIVMSKEDDLSTGKIDIEVNADTVEHIDDDEYIEGCGGLEKKIADFIQNVNEKYGIGEDATGMHCATGDPVVELIWKAGCEGLAKECEVREWFDSPIQAWRWFVGAFNSYMIGREGPVYWRQRPRLDKWQRKDKPPVYVIYARLFAKLKEEK